jgi:hypothetical protein
MADEDQIELRLVLERWKAVRAQWGLTFEEEGGLVRGSGFSGRVGEVNSWGAAGMERRMRLMIDLSLGLSTLFVSEDRVRNWLRQPLRSAHGRSPIEAMSSSEEWIRFFKRTVVDFTS